MGDGICIILWQKYDQTNMQTEKEDNTQSAARVQTNYNSFSIDRHFAACAYKSSVKPY